MNGHVTSNEMFGTAPLVRGGVEVPWSGMRKQQGQFPLSQYVWIYDLNDSSIFIAIFFLLFAVYNDKICPHVTLDTQDCVPGNSNCQKRYIRLKTITLAPIPNTHNFDVWAHAPNLFFLLWSEWLDKHCLGSFGAMGVIVQQFATDKGRYSSDSNQTPNQGQ